VDTDRCSTADASHVAKSNDQISLEDVIDAAISSGEMSGSAAVAHERPVSTGQVTTAAEAT